MPPGANFDSPAAPLEQREARLRVDITIDEGELRSQQKNLEGLRNNTKHIEGVLAMDGIRGTAEVQGEKWHNVPELHPDINPVLLDRAQRLAEEYKKLAADATETVAEKILEAGDDMYHEALARYAQATQEGGSAHLGLLHQILHFEHLAHTHDPGNFHPVPWDHVETMAKFAQGATSHPNPSQRQEYAQAAKRHPVYGNHHRLIDLHTHHTSS